jgi:hypothetical protein
MKRTLAFVIAGITLVLGGVSLDLTGEEAPAYATDPPTNEADFSVDLDTGVGGIQTTRTVAQGAAFNIVIETNTVPDTLPWEAYQITLRYNDAVLDAVTAGGWDDAPAEGTQGGNVFAFATANEFCTPATQATSVFNADNSIGEDDSGINSIAMTCTEEVPGTDHTGDGPLVQFAFLCDTSGSSTFTIDDISNTFLFDASGNDFNHHQHAATLTCGTGTAPTDTPTTVPTNTFTPGPGVSSATPLPTNTRTRTPTATRTAPPDTVLITPTPRAGTTGGGTQPPPAPGEPGAQPTAPGGAPGGSISGPDTGTGSGAEGAPWSMMLLTAGLLSIALGMMPIARRAAVRVFRGRGG